MSRNVSATARQALYDQSSGEVFLVLLEIDHPDLTAPIRLVHNTEEVIHGGNTYAPYAFKVDLPDENEDGIGNAKLTIDATDRQIVYAVRAVTDAPSLTIKIVLASSPDVIEAGPLEFKLGPVSYNAEAVTVDLIYEDRLHLKVPYLTFTPEYFGGLF